MIVFRGHVRVMSRIVGIRLFALCLAVGVHWTWAASGQTEKEKDEPLIMDNADHFEGSRSRGEYILTGKVRFTHGALKLETERAVWMKDKNQVICESGMKIRQRGSLLTADRGSYDKSQGKADAEGNVFMRDSSGDVVATGRSVVYMRFKHLATLSGDPVLRRFYTSKDSTASKARPDTARADSLPSANHKMDSAGRDPTVVRPGVAATDSAASASDAGKRFAALPFEVARKGKMPAPARDKSLGNAEVTPKKDTLVIRGDVMTYDDSLQVAIADGRVRIDRDKLKITCKKAEYHDASDSLFLLGDPQMVMEDNQVKGLIMRMGMHGEDIRSLLVKGQAQAHSSEPATDSTVARQSDVSGDSLFLTFKEKAIDSVQVFKNAKGAYFDVDKPEFVNKMSGEYMVLRFRDKQIHGANVVGGAKSTYYHFEKKKLKGRNDAEGDTIDFAFKKGKVDEVVVTGRAKGTYFGEKQKKNRDSTAVQGKATAKATRDSTGNISASEKAGIKLGAGGKNAAKAESGRPNPGTAASTTQSADSKTPPASPASPATTGAATDPAQAGPPGTPAPGTGTPIKTWRKK